MSTLGVLTGALASGVVVLVAMPRRRRIARLPRRRSLARPTGTAEVPGRLRPRNIVLMLAATLLLVAPPISVALMCAAAIAPLVDQRRIRARGTRALEDALPDAVDLLLLCTSAGRTLPLAHPLVAERVAPALADALGRAVRDAALGRPRADALLDALGPLGDRPRRLGRLLADHLRYGVALAPALERFGAELRVERRRRAERDARRVPVRLLAPLIACVLPAFALLTVVPLLAASLHALPR
ncbi:MAG: type II secretion system F family protein [Microthrixaceae bacterium]